MRITSETRVLAVDNPANGNGVYHLPGSDTPTACWDVITDRPGSLNEHRRGDLPRGLHCCQYCIAQTGDGTHQQVSQSLADMQPEDLGLSPIGDRPPGSEEVAD